MANPPEFCPIAFPRRDYHSNRTNPQQGSSPVIASKIQRYAASRATISPFTLVVGVTNLRHCQGNRPKPSAIGASRHSRAGGNPRPELVAKSAPHKRSAFSSAYVAPNGPWAIRARRHVCITSVIPAKAGLRHPCTNRSSFWSDPFTRTVRNSGESPSDDISAE